jgi:hypothetical protein
LVLIPSLLAILNDLRLAVHRHRYGVWPKRLDVEPATNRHDHPLTDARGPQPALPSVDVCN